MQSNDTWRGSLTATLGGWKGWLSGKAADGGGAIDRFISRLDASRSLGPWCIILSCAIVMIAQALEYHKAYLPWYPETGAEVPPRWPEPPVQALFYHYLSPYLHLIAMLGGLVFHLALIRSSVDGRRIVIPLWLASGFLATWVIMADLYDQWERVSHVTIGEPHSPWAYTGKGIALGLIIFAPAIAISYYQGRLIWEKLVLKSVAAPFAFCVLSIACIVVLFDLEDNLGDFKKENVPLIQILGFYINLFPNIFVQATAPAITLAVVFGLVRLVRFNELIALLNAGLSLFQIVTPILTFTGFVCLIATASNYHWAPRAEGQRQAVIQGIKVGNGSSILQSNVLHYNPLDRRSWFIGSVPFNLRDEKMKRVHVHEFDIHGQITRSIFAPTAIWWAEGFWSFYRGQEVTYTNGVPSKTSNFTIQANGLMRQNQRWRETPWDIIAPTLNPADMGVPELAAYLDTPRLVTDPDTRQHYFGELLHRFSFPWQAFCLVLLSIPLICRTSRHALVSGSGIALAALVLDRFLLNNVALKLGRAGLLSPYLAAWLPHLIIGVPAFLLLWWRSSGFTLPRFAVPLQGRWRDRWRILRGRRTRPWRGRDSRAFWFDGELGKSSSEVKR